MLPVAYVTDIENEMMQIDLFSFVSTKFAERLITAGYPTPSGSHEDVVLAYLNVHARRVPIGPRTIRKLPNYSVPSHLAAGENAFMADAMSGADLLPYQSTLLMQADWSDGMLFDFGIQHFHLGVGQHPRMPKFKVRADPLLFAVVTPSELYCVGFFSHGAWSQQSLLDTVHASWPHLLAPFVVKGASGLAHTNTDDDLATLRKARINSFSQRPDGTIHAPPGGGVTTAGGSIHSTLALDRLRDICDDRERQVRNVIAGLVENGEMLSPAEIKFEEQGGEVFVLADGFRGKLSGVPLPVPL